MNKPFARIIEPFKIEHLELMDVRSPEKEMIADARDKYAALAQLGTGGTIVYDGCVLAAFGFIEIWRGMYEVWVIPSVHVSRHPRVFLRTVRSYVQQLIQIPTFHRLQSPAIADSVHDRWMLHLGFRNETPDGMANYGSGGERYNMWSLTK